MEFTKELLLTQGFFEHEYNKNLLLLPLGYSSIWFLNNVFYLAGCDCPTEQEATQLNINNLNDIATIIKLVK